MIALSVVVFTIGVAVGYYLASTLKTGKQADEEMQPPQEPTKLLTVGSLVRWKEDTLNMYEIERFQTDEDGQTVADINVMNGTIGFTVPVEELEAVEE